MTAPAALPVLMRDGEVISLKEAVFRTGKSEKTISRWCWKEGIGRRSEPGAPSEISAVALEANRYGDQEAVEDLRQGNFGTARVKRYMDLSGLD